MIIDMPKAVDNIIRILNDAGYEAYIVGGCVRDSLLGTYPSDWDITTSATPECVKSLFRRTVDTGIKHGTVTVLDHDEQYEVTTYRIDGEYNDGRHPESVEFTNELREDLRRRDFTINAMAYHPSTGLVDLFGGREDLDAGIIRCVGDARERFGEDALRMMRAVRFAARLGYAIEQSTFDAIKELASTLSKVSAERIREEAVKLLVSDHPEFFRLFYESGLTSVFMPEFDEMMHTGQNHPHHKYGVGDHTLVALQNIRADRLLRLAILFHDIAKPRVLKTDAKGITHFYGHPAVSEKMACEIMRRLKFDNATISTVSKLVLYHDRKIELNDYAVRKVMCEMGAEIFPLYLEVRMADTLAQSEYLRDEKIETIEGLRRIYNDITEKKQCVKISELAVSGKDLIKSGVKPGPQIGALLECMLQEVLRYPEHNNAEYLLKTYVK